MVKLYFLNKLRGIASVIVLLKYVSWCLFFVFQGRAIEMAVSRAYSFDLLLNALFWYILLKVITMLSDIAEKFFIEFLKNKELNLQWRYLFPAKIYKDNENKSDNIHLLFYDYLPKLYDLETAIITNTCSFFIIAFISLAFLLYNGFGYGIYILSAIFILNYVNRNIFVSKIETYERHVEHNKLNVLRWVTQFFCSYKEISHSWNNHYFEKWKDGVYSRYYKTKTQSILLYLYRDLISQILVEIPFLLNTALVICAVYQNYISISQMFVWVGVSQFMINASNAYLNNKVKIQNKLGLVKEINYILNDFETIKKNEKLILLKNMSNHVAKVTLSDGTQNILGLDPNIYFIKGANGAGKSTLLNIISGYDRKLEIQNNNHFQMLLRFINNFGIRLISREPVLFHNFENFTLQICGPDYDRSKTWQEAINRTLSKIFDESLSNKWLKIFHEIEGKYHKRRDKIFSSGEKVILSLMRAFSSWDDNVNLLIIDECDSFLDIDTKELFAQTIKSLSSYVAIYMVKHDNCEVRHNTNVISHEECTAT